MGAIYIITLEWSNFQENNISLVIASPLLLMQLT